MLVGYLSYLDAKRRYYEGDKDRAVVILDWLKGFFQKGGQLSSLIEDFFMRVENYSKMNASSIGVVLPLSGSKASFGKRALFGIDQSIRDNALDKYKIHIADSRGSSSVGSYRVKELAESHFVSTIIGGLFPHEAMGEYLEAKNTEFCSYPCPRFISPRKRRITSCWRSPDPSNPRWSCFFQNRC